MGHVVLAKDAHGLALNGKDREPMRLISLELIQELELQKEQP